MHCPVNTFSGDRCRRCSDRVIDRAHAVGAVGSRARTGVARVVHELHEHRHSEGGGARDGYEKAEQLCGDPEVEGVMVTIVNIDQKAWKDFGLSFYGVEAEAEGEHVDGDRAYNRCKREHIPAHDEECTRGVREVCKKQALHV